MCFTINVNIVRDELEKRYGATLEDQSDYRPSYYYHAFSFPDLPVVFGDTAGGRQIDLMKWGLIPSYTVSSTEALRIRDKTVNARAETIEERPSFRNSFPTRRCLLPVNGFFEWQHLCGAKIPWYIYNPGESIISLGALYDRWSDDEGRSFLNTFTIITTRANSLLSKIHNTKNRMPLIITKEQEERWISPLTSPAEARAMMKSFPENLLSAHTISPLIGNRRAERNVPQLIEPWSRPEEPTLF
jgi:putative SOS response-associated peptidase YedK